MNNPKISIISPVYNVEKYICRCVDSIIAQTFTDWELILVDDGSPDTSGTICDQYASQDSRIRVIHRQNGGVSAARQTGLDASRGEYVIHADPDDWVEPTMLEELYAKAKAEDADIVVCDYYVNKVHGQHFVKQQLYVNTAHGALHQLFHGLLASLWNKLIKRSCYIHYGLRFYPGINYCEDFLVLAQLLQHEEIRIVYHPQAYYHYCENNQSITRRYTRSIYEQRLQFVDILKRIIDGKEFSDDIIKMKCDIYQEGLIADVLNKEEIRKNFEEYKEFLKNKSVRWRLFYHFSSIKLYRIAQYFVKQ